MNASISSPNRVQVSQRSNLIFTPIPYQFLSPSHPSTSISPNTIQFLPSSDSVRNGSDSYYNNNFGSWANRTPYTLWNPLLVISHFLNIPKNLIVPPVCQLQVCPTIVGTQRGDIIIATAVNNARIFGIGGNDIIECGIGNCNVFTGFGNNVLMSGSSTSANLYGGSGGYLRPGNNIFIGGGGVTLMVGGNGNDQFYAGTNNLFSGGNDIMIGGSGANYFDCGRNGHAVILDFNPAKGDTKAPNCKFVITSYSNNIFGAPGLFPGRNLRDSS
jgi:Ca2+-binding RTX toxin-like protein